LLLLVEGPVVYKAVLSRAFPNLFFSRSFDDRHGRFLWGTYIKRAGDQEERDLTSFCSLLREVWLVEDDLTETVALSLHTETSPAGGIQRSSIGQLVYEAKAYDRMKHPGNQAKARDLAERMADLVRRHPTYRQADLLVSVPGSNSEKAYDLPVFLCQELSQRLNILAPQGVVRKTRESKPMKDFRTLQEKIDNVEGVFQADEQEVRGKKVLLVDDIYQTGFSINEVGRALKMAGAQFVLGLVATKTMQDLGENLPW
jgi:hypothetical protein